MHGKVALIPVLKLFFFFFFKQLLTLFKIKIMKQTLRWLISSILLGAILTLFCAPNNSQEFMGYWMCGTAFFLGMLINMLGAKEK